MTTLETMRAAHAQLGAAIAAMLTTLTRIFVIDRAEIVLGEREHYAGLILGEDGKPLHHLVLLPGDAEDIGWEAAKEFAVKAGGELPTRREQALLFANLKSQFDERYYWSSEQHASNADYAWGQYFVYGGQDSNGKSATLRARAVRRLTIS